MENMTQFSKEDVDQHRLLSELLTKCAKWDVNTAEAVNLYRSLVWLANLKTKIESSLVEDVKVYKQSEDTKG